MAKLRLAIQHRDPTYQTVGNSIPTPTDHSYKELSAHLIFSMEATPPNFPTQFALLYPSNRCAIIAFDHVASEVKAGTNWNPHARKYMAIYPERLDLEYIGSESENEGGSGPQMQKRQIWRGHYRLDFNMPPRDPRLGWVLGGGKFGPGEESPEFVLTERKTRDGIFGRHALLSHNYSSGALMLRLANEGLVFVNGKDVGPSKPADPLPAETRLECKRLPNKSSVHTSRI